jgi:hypothetical protein
MDDILRHLVPTVEDGGSRISYQSTQHHIPEGHNFYIAAVKTASLKHSSK